MSIWVKSESVSSIGKMNKCSKETCWAKLVIRRLSHRCASASAFVCLCVCLWNIAYISHFFLLHFWIPWKSKFAVSLNEYCSLFRSCHWNVLTIHWKYEQKSDREQCLSVYFRCDVEVEVHNPMEMYIFRIFHQPIAFNGLWPFQWTLFMLSPKAYPSDGEEETATLSIRLQLPIMPDYNFIEKTMLVFQSRAIHNQFDSK